MEWFLFGSHHVRLDGVLEIQSIEPMHWCDNLFIHSLGRGLSPPRPRETGADDNTFSDLLERSVKPSRLVVGLISGTSVTPLTLRSATEGTGLKRVKLIHYAEHAHNWDVKRAVLKSSDLGLREIAELNVRAW